MTAEVTVQGGQGYLSGVPAAVLEDVQKACRFRPAGFQYSPKFNRWVGKGSKRRRAWDGWVKLYKHSKFPAGLVERVCEVLRDRDIEFDLKVEKPAEYADVPMRLQDIQTRDYQDDALEAALLKPRGVIRAPTGSGKTAIGARIVAARGKRALIVVPTIDLLHQYRDFLSEHLKVEENALYRPTKSGNVAYARDSYTIGQLGDGVVNPREVTVGTVRTVAKAMGVAYETYEYGEYDDRDDTKAKPADLREWIQGIGTLVVDEAHILGAQVIYDVATRMHAPNKYGMSASPWRDDGADLMIEAATGPVIYRIGTRRLVAEGWLVPPLIQTVSTEGLWTPAAWQKNQWAKCYRQEIVENPIRNALVAEWATKYDTPTLVLVKQVQHGRLLQDLIPESRFLYGGDPGEIRKQAWDDLRSGQLKVAICTTIADMGLDLPVCQNLVLAGGGKSSTRHLQRIGRVARPYPDKGFARVIDFSDAHVHDWFANHEKERRKIEHAEWAEAGALWV